MKCICGQDHGEREQLTSLQMMIAHILGKYSEIEKSPEEKYIDTLVSQMKDRQRLSIHPTFRS
jgi:hypothetical protein